jgi:sugar O-acyltransferase (sialic acid O-acetyltransferase NeuD family)
VTIEPLLIVGAGGFARETAAAVAAAGGRQLLGFLDDRAELHGTAIDGVPVLGPVEAALDHPDARLLVCTGNPYNYWSRRTLVGRLELPAERFASFVHPTAWLAPGTVVGEGSVLLAGVVATAAVTIGAHVAVMPGTILTHDGVIGDFATIASGVRLGGNAVVGEGAYIGAGVLVREGVTVGRWSMLGMGSLVLADVPAGEVWVGAPARRLRAAALPPELQPPETAVPRTDAVSAGALAGNATGANAAATNAADATGAEADHRSEGTSAP